MCRQACEYTGNGNQLDSMRIYLYLAFRRLYRSFGKTACITYFSVGCSTSVAGIVHAYGKGQMISPKPFRSGQPRGGKYVCSVITASGAPVCMVD